MHPTTFFSIVSGFCFSGTHCKGVSKQLCVYHLYRNVFLAQTRIRSHLGCIFLFRNLIVSIPTIKTLFETPFSSCCVYHRSLSIASTSRQEGFIHPKHNAFKGVSKQLCVYHLYRNVFLMAQTRIRPPFFSAFQKGVSNPLIKTALRLSCRFCKKHP